MISIGKIADKFFTDCVKEEIEMYELNNFPTSLISATAKEMRHLVNEENWDLDYALRKAMTDSIDIKGVCVPVEYEQRKLVVR